MQVRWINGYVAAMCLAATSVLWVTDWRVITSLNTHELSGLGALVLMALFSEGLAVRLDVGKSSSRTSVTFIPMLASAQLFGPASAVLLMSISAVFGEFVIRRKAFVRAIFNVTQLITAAWVAGWVFTLIKVAIHSPLGAGTLSPGQLGPFVAFGLVFLALNHAAVSLAIALSQGRRFPEVWAWILQGSGASLQDLLISPIALAVAFLYMQAGAPGILVILLPLLFIRHSYANTSLLREANHDLLAALVKAIETRDPYTSGHSLRVSHLARRIAQGLGLGATAVERIERAALLHDVGKIEALYTEILAKPEALSADEVGVIRSHVTKGEELLRKLSSVPEDVILAVRHHHERPDGSGYPDGLVREQIPLGARVIGVCDAIDAMLSNRPYRSALSVPTVMEQLLDHSGSQFDAAIVNVVLASNLIGEYADIVWASQIFSPNEAPADGMPRPSRTVLVSPHADGGAAQRARRYLRRIPS